VLLAVSSAVVLMVPQQAPAKLRQLVWQWQPAVLEAIEEDVRQQNLPMLSLVLPLPLRFPV